MGQEQGYTNFHDNFQELEFYCSFYIAKGSSVKYRFLIKFKYLDFISVKY